MHIIVANDSGRGENLPCHRSRAHHHSPHYPVMSAAGLNGRRLRRVDRKHRRALDHPRSSYSAKSFILNTLAMPREQPHGRALSL